MLATCAECAGSVGVHCESISDNPEMIILRDVVARGKGAWEQEVFYSPFFLSGSHLCRTWGLCTILWTLRLKVPDVPALLVGEPNARQIPQGGESSSLELKGTPFARCYKTYGKGILPMLEVAQGVQLQCILIIALGDISCFLLLLNFCLILPNMTNLC